MTSRTHVRSLGIWLTNVAACLATALSYASGNCVQYQVLYLDYPASAANIPSSDRLALAHAVCGVSGSDCHEVCDSTFDPAGGTTYHQGTVGIRQSIHGTGSCAVDGLDGWFDFIAAGTGPCPPPPVPQFDPNKNACDGTCPAGRDPLLTGDPINIGLKANIQKDEDYRSPGPFPLTFQRRYNSNASTDDTYLPNRTLGGHWRHNYDRTVAVDTSWLPVVATVVRPDGRMLNFKQTSGGWAPDADIEDKLTQLTDGSGNPAGWSYVTADSVTETYDVSGRLLSIADRTGVTQTLAYSTSSTSSSIAPESGLLISVTDSFGRQLNLAYDASARLHTLTDSAGGVFTYGYDSNGMLQTVTYPDTYVRTYIYGEFGAADTSLTGIVDENSTRFATFQYDSSGRAISSQHAGGWNPCRCLTPRILQEM